MIGSAAFSPEIWRDVVGYEGLYQVSSKGRVKSKKTILKGDVTYIRGRYRRVCLYKDGKPSWMTVGWLVLEAFVGPRSPGMVMCHGPGGSEDDRVPNLSWGTQSKNLKEDRERDGTIVRGEQQHLSKLREIDVRFIRLWLRRGYFQREIARVFGVTRENISAISTGRAWGWLVG